MKDLLEIRDEIDVIDRQLVELFEKRMALTGAVAEYKIKTGKAVFDPVRESEKLEKVASQAMSEDNREAVKELFSDIMFISRKNQYQIMKNKGIIFDAGDDPASD